jgi:hypothetical protein
MSTARGTTMYSIDPALRPAAFYARRSSVTTELCPMLSNSRSKTRGNRGRLRTLLFGHFAGHLATS